jgi:tetratricopeptide (TPR) repeat protein
MTQAPQDLLEEISRLNRSGRAAEAETLARHLLTQWPDAPPALNALAVLLAQRGALGEALPLARRASALEPGEVVFHTVLGRILYLKEDLNAAEAVCLQAAALKSTPEALHNLGTVRAAQSMANATRLRQQGRDAEALAIYERVIAEMPDYVPAHCEYTDVAWLLGHDIRDLKSYAFARARVGETPALLLAEAETRLRLDQPQAAHELLTRANRAHPNRADVANALARAEAMMSRWDEARNWFEAAIAARPAEISYRRDLAAFLLRIRAFSEAQDVSREALALAPFDQSSLACLASAQRALGDRKMIDMDLVHEVHLPVPHGFVDAASFNNAVAEELSALHTDRIAPLDQTLRGGTQTTGTLFAHPTRVVGLLRETIARELENYCAALPRDPAHPFLSRAGSSFSFAGSWSSCLALGGFHVNHIHPGGWVSSAYYVALPNGDDDGALQFGQSQFLLEPEDEPLRTVKPAVGKLVLFPSYFWHGTMPFQSEGRRLTVAFDALPAN